MDSVDYLDARWCARAILREGSPESSRNSSRSSSRRAEQEKEDHLALDWMKAERERRMEVEVERQLERVDFEESVVTMVNWEELLGLNAE